MGKAYADGEFVIVEMNLTDIITRFVPLEDGRMLSMRGLLKDLAWFILTSQPASRRLLDGRAISYAVTEAIDDKIRVTFMPGVPSGKPSPPEK